MWKSLLLVSFVFLAAGQSVWASKARLVALGDDQDGSLFIKDDYRNIFFNVANVNRNRNKANFEWGSEAATSTFDLDNDPKPEGGFLYGWNDYVFGVHLGYENNTATNLRLLSASSFGHTVPQEDNKINLFVGADHGIKWGFGLEHASNEDESNLNQNKETVWAARLGAIVGKFEPFVNVSLQHDAENTGDHSAPRFRGDTGYKAGTTYRWSDNWIFYGWYSNFSWDQTSISGFIDQKQNGDSEEYDVAVVRKAKAGKNSWWYVRLNYFKSHTEIDYDPNALDVESWKLPLTIEKADGAYIYDNDGKDYIDFCMSFGPLILGHRSPLVEEELHGALSRGWSFGACERYSLELAEYILSKNGFGEQIRFVNSGTEAVMTALRLMRGTTGKNKIIKFNGCYHGHVDSMLIKAGSGLAGTAEASSSGVSNAVADETLIVNLGDREEVAKCFNDHKDQIAGIVIEPLPANNGLLTQDNDFLQFLRDITKDNDALLLFDEVISGFRVGFGGMTKETGIQPDIVTYGKIIGGGLPVGAICANKNIMENLAPIGSVYQAGTLSANPLAMVGGLATLKQLTTTNYEKIDQNTESIITLFSKWLKEYDNGKFRNYNVISNASLFWIVPNRTSIKNVDEIPSDIGEQFNELFETLLNKGIYLSPNAYEVGFVSLAHDEKVCNELEKRLWN